LGWELLAQLCGIVCCSKETNSMRNLQSAADGSVNHLQFADRFTGHPPTVDAIQHCANTIDLDYGGLCGNDLDDWLRAERELTEAHRLRASANDKNR
jgi:hypothetical protein